MYICRNQWSEPFRFLRDIALNPEMTMRPVTFRIETGLRFFHVGKDAPGFIQRFSHAVFVCMRQTVHAAVIVALKDRGTKYG